MSSYGTSGTELRDHAVPLVAPSSGTRGPIGALSRPVAGPVLSSAEAEGENLSRRSRPETLQPLPVIIHYRGKGDEQRAFPALPCSGDYIDAGGQLWRVALVVFGATVDVYAVRLADILADETRREWQGWGDVAAPELSVSNRAIDQKCHSALQGNDRTMESKRRGGGLTARTAGVA